MTGVERAGTAGGQDLGRTWPAKASTLSPGITVGDKCVVPRRAKGLMKMFAVLHFTARKASPVGNWDVGFGDTQKQVPGRATHLNILSEGCSPKTRSKPR